MTTTIETTWQSLLAQEKQKEYFKSILAFLNDQYRLGKTIYPKKSDLFNALKLTPFQNVRVVIIGQDPYHGVNQAHGLCFSVAKGVSPPPSLLNIFKELESDLGIAMAPHGCLESWAKQGVLLLNTSLSVEARKPQSHSHIGWQQFTDQVIDCLNQHQHPIVYLLWGSHAQKKQPLIDSSKHHILKAPHPSPLSAYRGFFGCKHFSKANTLLTQNQRPPIDWSIPA